MYTTLLFLICAQQMNTTYVEFPFEKNTDNMLILPGIRAVLVYHFFVNV